jgi:hypothetical protein
VSAAGLAIRPIRDDDLSTVVRLYSELDRRDPTRPNDGYVRFFGDTLLGPYSDPKLPTLVCEAASGQVVGFIGSHSRRFKFGSEELSAACFGPLIVDHRSRGRGIANLLFDRFLSGSQDLTFNDRSVDQVSRMWRRRGATIDNLASVEWIYRLRPAGHVVASVLPRGLGLRRLPGRKALAGVERPAMRRRAPEPVEGASSPLSVEAILDLLDRVAGEFDLRPAYDRDFLHWLFEAMQHVVLGGRLSRRLVTREDGSAAGYYVMYVLPHGSANVIQLVSSGADAGLVLDHLIHDAAATDALEVRGRLESFLLPHLRARGCSLEFGDWTGIQAADPAISGAVLAGRSSQGGPWCREWMESGGCDRVQKSARA